eukprot:jgi/Antlo1/1464/2559
MKLSAGKYKVIATLNVSHSLSSLSRGVEYSPRDVYKVLLQTKDTNYVLYFVDGVVFGPMSVILLKEDTGPLVQCGDYEVVEHTAHVCDKKLVEKLIEKARKKQNA